MQILWGSLNKASKSAFQSVHLHIYIYHFAWILHNMVINPCVDLTLRESVSDGPYQKTEEGAKEDGQKAQSQPATQE